MGIELQAVTARPRREGWSISADLPEAFERLFRAEYTRVAAIAQRVLDDRQEAEDVAQDVFLSFYRSHPPTAPYAAAWLRAAAAHAARHARRGRRDAAALAERTDASADPEREALDAERRAEVRDALARLPAKSAAILALRYSGLSYAEVAEAMGIGTNQIGTLLRRAEERFKREVARERHE